MIFLLVAVALTAMLLAGCGGGADPGAKVEAALGNYLSTVDPLKAGFPVGAGFPRVRHKACKDGHFKVEKGQVLSDKAGMSRARFPEEVALWSCVVTVGSLVLPTTVAVTGSTEVVWAEALPLVAFVLE